MRLFDELSDDQMEELKYYITEEYPFGPENASRVHEVDAQRMLFNQNNVLCAEYKMSPSIIVGRRGSGKTSIISNTQFFDEHSYFIKIDPEEALNYVRDAVFHDDPEREEYVEVIAKFWTLTFDAMLMAHVLQADQDHQFLSVPQFLASTNVSLGSTLSGVVQSLRKSASMIQKNLPGYLITALLEFIESDSSNYANALDELNKHFKRNGLSSVMILDSVEDYILKENRNKQILGGLLKCAGEYGDRRRHLRLCIPAESYFDIRSCSKNPLKDFSRNLLLQWLPSEIYGVIAWKFMLYCRLYDEKKYEKIRRTNFSDRSSVVSVLRKILPDKITNAIGIEEPTLPYIMRHTQILPRQAIVILNRILGHRGNTKSRWRGDEQERWTNVDSAAIVDGIKFCEGILGEEIFTAFETKYPDARAYCERCITELPRIFSNGELQIVYRRRGQSTKTVHGGYMEFDEFKTMLVEIGAIGRVRKRGSIYAEAEFEYAQPGRLHMSVDDDLCLHPIFSGEFSSNRNDKEGLVVYPQKEWFEEESGRNLRLYT